MVKLVAITPNAEELISYCARVSNPANQENYDTAPKLLKYLIDHKHWSPFEMANMVVEIETSRAISAQILRHRSFSFQEFSQRYAEVQEAIIYPTRTQDPKNRQNSVDNASWELEQWFKFAQAINNRDSVMLYEEALEKGVAKELARMLLPMSSKTRLYMNGTIRSWMHYLDVREDETTQKEHRDIAYEIESLIAQHLPTIWEAWRG